MNYLSNRGVCSAHIAREPKIKAFSLDHPNNVPSRNNSHDSPMVLTPYITPELGVYIEDSKKSTV